MLSQLRLLLRLIAVGCFLIAPALYLLVAHHAHLTCDRAAGTCVLEETRPLRAVRVQTVPLADVLDAGCQSEDWMESPQAATILKNARRPFNAGASGVWETVGGGVQIPKYRVVLLTHGGIIPVTNTSGLRDATRSSTCSTAEPPTASWTRRQGGPLRCRCCRRGWDGAACVGRPCRTPRRRSATSEA